MNKELREYIYNNIFPRYERYYSHGMTHINSVIDNLIMLANYYGLDDDMAYVTGAYHDIALEIDRENHELESGKVLKNDLNLQQYFSSEQIEIMGQAVEDHRGSRKERPRNKYGEILSDSDRDFDIEILAKRQLATSLKNYPEVASFDEHFEICYQYMLRKVNDSGNFNLWTNNPILIERRKKFETDFFDKEYTKKVYKKEYTKISSDGTKDKIMNYYLDY